MTVFIRQIGRILSYRKVWCARRPAALLLTLAFMLASVVGTQPTASVHAQGPVLGTAMIGPVTEMVDTTPPTLTCSVTPNVLQLADGQLVPVSATVNMVDELSGPAGFSLISVEGNEAGAASGIQDFSIDTPDTQGLLAAEHDPIGNGGGRVYTLTYRGMDQAGNTATCSATVSVAQD